MGINIPVGILGNFFLLTDFVLFCCNSRKGAAGCSCIYWNVCRLIYFFTNFVLSHKGSG